MIRKLVDILTNSGLCVSKADAKRLIEQGGVIINGEVQTDMRAEIDFKKGDVIKIGKLKEYINEC